MQYRQGYEGKELSMGFFSDPTMHDFNWLDTATGDNYDL